MLLSLSMNPILLILFLTWILLMFIVYLAFVLKGYFYSYLMFLLFVSGLIMMLMYFCSIILSDKVLIVLDFVHGLLIVVFSSMAVPEGGDLAACKEKTIYGDYFSLLKYLTYPHSVFSLFFVLYLLLCLVVVYEIVKKCSGPLRMQH